MFVLKCDYCGKEIKNIINKQIGTALPNCMKLAWRELIYSEGGSSYVEAPNCKIESVLICNSCKQQILDVLNSKRENKEY